MVLGFLGLKTDSLTSNFSDATDRKKRKRTIVVKNKKKTSKVVVNATKKNRKVVVKDRTPAKVAVTDKKKSRTVKVTKSTNSGQLLRALASTPKNQTSPDTIKLTGLTEEEQTRRKAVNAKAQYEKEILANRDKFSNLNFIKELFKELPKSPGRIAEATPDLLNRFGKFQAGGLEQEAQTLTKNPLAEDAPLIATRDQRFRPSIAQYHNHRTI